MGITRTAAIESVVTSVANRVALRIRLRFLFRESALTVVEGISLAVGGSVNSSLDRTFTGLKLLFCRGEYGGASSCMSACARGL